MFLKDQGYMTVVSTLASYQNGPVSSLSWDLSV